jgi:hypothetical protein
MKTGLSGGASKGGMSMFYKGFAISLTRKMMQFFTPARLLTVGRLFLTSEYLICRA